LRPARPWNHGGHWDYFKAAPGATGRAETSGFPCLGKPGWGKDPLVSERILPSSCNWRPGGGLFGDSSTFSFPLSALHFQLIGVSSSSWSSESRSEEIVTSPWLLGIEPKMGASAPSRGRTGTPTRSISCASASTCSSPIVSWLPVASWVSDRILAFPN